MSQKKYTDFGGVNDVNFTSVNGQSLSKCSFFDDKKVERDLCLFTTIFYAIK